jgi:hypothetical protein
LRRNGAGTNCPVGVPTPAHGFSDRQSEFLIAVGNLCIAAERASLTLVVTTTTGVEVTGVPHVHEATPEEELDETGYARTFRIGDAVVNLDEVASAAIRQPL